MKTEGFPFRSYRYIAVLCSASCREASLLMLLGAYVVVFVRASWTVRRLPFASYEKLVWPLRGSVVLSSSSNALYWYCVIWPRGACLRIMRPAGSKVRFEVFPAGLVIPVRS